MDEHVLDAEVQGCPATSLHQGIHVGLVRGVAELLTEIKFDFHCLILQFWQMAQNRVA